MKIQGTSNRLWAWLPRARCSCKGREGAGRRSGLLPSPARAGRRGGMGKDPSEARAQISRRTVHYFLFFCERLGLGTGEEGARLRGSQAHGGKCGEHPVIHRTQPGNELLCRGKHRWKRAAATPSQQHGNHRLVAF